jgi:hypothetical protein
VNAGSPVPAAGATGDDDGATLLAGLLAGRGTLAAGPAPGEVSLLSDGGGGGGNNGDFAESAAAAAAPVFEISIATAGDMAVLRTGDDGIGGAGGGRRARESSARQRGA